MDVFTPQQELQRPGLTILNGMVYIAYGSYADSDPYHGWVLGFSENSLAITAVFDTTPNQIPGGPTGGSEAHDGEGAIWMSGAELTTDGTNLYLVTANGDFDSDPAYGAYGDSVLKLGVTSTTSADPGVDGYGLAVADYFTPYNEAYLGNYQVDLDLGTSGAVLLPTQGDANPNEIIMIGKQGIAYLINRDDMGEFNSVSDNVIQELNLGNGMWGTPTYFDNEVYFHAQGESLEDFSLVNGVLSTASSATGTVVISSEGATPVISSNGTSNGVVWEIASSGYPPFQTYSLVAYNASTLQEIYSSSLGTASHFAVPVVADGLVFTAGQGFLDIFGEFGIVGSGSRPLPPTNFSASALSGTQILLKWTTTPVSGTLGITPYVQIYRHVGTSGAYSPLFVASGTVGSYTDTGLTAGTDYSYEIREVDSAGSSNLVIAPGVIPIFGSIAGRNTFYDDSIFDGDNPAANSSDAAAFATDKTALLPGETATFANYTSYVDGINGIAIDISNDFGTPVLGDFTFTTGNSSNPATWTAANAPDSMVILPGQGAGGSTRIEFVWTNDDAVTNAWLQITVSADTDTNLQSPDVFYFGNAVGETGNSTTDANVDATDQIGVRANNASGVSVTDPYDFNRDGNVDATDEAIARNNQTNFTSALQLIAVPAVMNLLPAEENADPLPPDLTTAPADAPGNSLAGLPLSQGQTGSLSGPRSLEPLQIKSAFTVAASDLFLFSADPRPQLLTGHASSASPIWRPWLVSQKASAEPALGGSHRLQWVDARAELDPVRISWWWTPLR